VTLALALLASLIILCSEPASAESALLRYEEVRPRN
jgi:hypothetical protein